MQGKWHDSIHTSLLEQVGRLLARVRTCTSKEEVIRVLLDSSMVLTKAKAGVGFVAKGGVLRVSVTRWPNDHMSENLPGPELAADALPKAKRLEGYGNVIDLTANDVFELDAAMEAVYGVPMSAGDDVSALLCLAFTKLDSESLKMMARAMELVGMLGSAFLENLEARQDLLDSRAKYKTLFELAGDAIFLMKDYKFVDCNNKTLDLFGCSRDWIIGKHPSEVSPARQMDGRPSFEAANAFMNAALERGETRFEWLHQRLDGKVFETEVSLKRVELSGVPHLHAVVRDVTERKQLEEEFRQAQKMEAVGRLAGGVAHDVNNMLGAIMGYASLMQMECSGKGSVDGEDIEEYIAAILEACSQARELTTNLLGFARRGKHKHEPVVLEELLQRVTAIVQRSLPKEIVFEVNLETGTPAVMGDAEQLVQALINLCINGSDAMEHGGTLRLSARKVVLSKDRSSYGKRFGSLADGTYVELAVSDQGCGMTREVLEHALEPFFTTKSEGKGTGLGLSMAYGTVRSHGGDMYISSEPGRGTTVTILVPAADEGAREPGVVEKNVTGAVVLNGGLGRNKTVLVVDDEEIVRKAEAKVLKRLGYEVLEAGDGLSAVELYKEKAGEIDLVVLDIAMPGMDGEETFNALLEIDPHVRVLVASAYSQQGKAARMLSSGAKDFLQKPFDMATLVEKLKRIMA